MKSLFGFVNNWRWESENGMADDIGFIIDRMIAAIKWSWRTETLISIAILTLFGLWFWTFGHTFIRRKRIQSRHRKLLKKEMEERTSRR